MRVKRWGRKVGGVVLLLALTSAAGCSGTPVGTRTTPSPQPAGPTSASVAPASIPADGTTLAALGFQNGPRQAFSVPRDAYITAGSDQASLVTVVFASPEPAEVYEYLVMTLPRTGFRIEARNSAPGSLALDFSGWGWTGQFTGQSVGQGSTSAVTLRPGR